jgi:Tfp pilus assembly protein PilO
METGIDKEKIMRYKALLEQHLSDPIKLRLMTAGGLLLLSVVLIYMPLSKKIDENKRLLAAEKERNSYIVDYEKLQKQAESFQSLIGDKCDTNEWANYLLGGLGKYQVKLRGMESKQPRKVGPYGAAAFSLDIEGEYSELKNYIEWVESSPRLIRIDTMQFEKRPKGLKMKILILGIIPKK